MCLPLKICPGKYPYLCNDNICASNSDKCSKVIACGDNKSFCDYRDCKMYR